MTVSLRVSLTALWQLLDVLKARAALTNSHRLHSAIDYLSQREFEQAFMMKNARPSAAPTPHSREAAWLGTR